LDILI